MSANRVRLWVLGITRLLIHPITTEAEQVGTAYTYQGGDDENRQPVNDSADCQLTPLGRQPKG